MFYFLWVLQKIIEIIPYYYRIMLPIEIVNKILVYIGELNNTMIITQYQPITNKEYYMINLNTDLLWRIKSTLIMKRIYPVCNADDYLETKQFIELYQFGIPHYENELRVNRIK